MLHKLAHRCMVWSAGDYPTKQQKQSQFMGRSNLRPRSRQKLMDMKPSACLTWAMTASAVHAANDCKCLRLFSFRTAQGTGWRL